MPGSSLSSLYSEQKSIRLDVSYYDDHEEEQLSRYPTAETISAIVNSGIDVNFSQFLTYYLFYKKRPGALGYSSYSEIGRHLDTALCDLDGWVRYEGGSLVASTEMVPQDLAVTERIGEACALCVAGSIHDLHEADWQKIPVHGGRSGFRTFDYQYECPSASDGTVVVQVEAKGTAVADSTAMDPKVRAQKVRIDEKKTSISESQTTGDYRYPADLRYGIISSIGRIGALHCWLTDPPSGRAADARVVRLLARLEFMFSWIRFLSGRSQLAACFATRLAALRTLADPFELDRVPLVRSNGERFDVPSASPRESSQGMFAKMCRIADGPAVGTLLGSPTGHLYFIGVQRQIYEMAVNQDFHSIMSYSDAGGTAKKHVNCALSRARAKNIGITIPEIGSLANRPYVSFGASGSLHFSKGSVVFGRVVPD